MGQIEAIVQANATSKENTSLMRFHRPWYAAGKAAIALSVALLGFTATAQAQ